MNRRTPMNTIIGLLLKYGGNRGLARGSQGNRPKISTSFDRSSGSRIKITMNPMKASWTSGKPRTWTNKNNNRDKQGSQDKSSTLLRFGPGFPSPPSVPPSVWEILSKPFSSPCLPARVSHPAEYPRSPRESRSPAACRAQRSPQNSPAESLAAPRMKET